MSFVNSQFRFALTSLSYQELVDEARRYAALMFPDWDFDSDIDLGRFALDIYLRAQVQQIEVANGWSQEAFLSSCRVRSSALAHAVSRGYTPQNPTPAVGSLSIEVEADLVNPRTVEQFEMLFSTRNFDRNNPIFFENAESFVIPVGVTLLTISIVAGQSYQESYTGDGAPDQYHVLEDYPVIDGSIAIEDDLSNTYTQVDDFVDSEATDKHFVVQLLTDGRSRVVFGDDSNGEAVQSGRVLTIDYRVGGGLESRVNADTIQTIEYSPYTVIQANNTEKLTEGNDEESLSSIKINAPAAFRRRDRLSRIEEVNDFCAAYSGVARTNAQLLGTTVLIPLVPDGGGAPSTILKNALAAAVDEKLIMGYISQVTDPTYDTVTIAVEFTTKQGFDSSEIENIIQTAILDYLDPTATEEVDNREVFVRDFGEPIRLNTISKIMQSYVDQGAIEQDFEITTPTADVPTTTTAIFTDDGSTVTATSRNTTTVEYRK